MKKIIWPACGKLRSTTPSRATVLSVPLLIFGMSYGVAVSAPFDTTDSERYLIIARHLLDCNIGNTDAQVNNSEVGANKAPVPAPSAFPNGPSLLGAVPDIPCIAAAIFSGIGGDGNIALTDDFGVINLQSVSQYADLAQLLVWLGHSGRNDDISRRGCR